MPPAAVAEEEKALVVLPDAAAFLPEMYSENRRTCMGENASFFNPCNTLNYDQELSGDNYV